MLTVAISQIVSGLRKATPPLVSHLEEFDRATPPSRAVSAFGSPLANHYAKFLAVDWLSRVVQLALNGLV